MAARREPKALELLTLGFRAWRGHPKPMEQSHLHAELEWNFLTRGSIEYFLAGRFYRVPTGRLAVFWAGMPHRLVSAQGQPAGLWVTVPLAWFIGWRLAPSVSQRLLRGELLLGPDAATATTNADERQLARWVDDLRGGSPEARRIALLEVEARLRRLALATQRSGEKRTPPTGVPQIERVTEFIGRNYAQELSVARLAEVAGLHPNYLMQLFRRTCGMSLWEYVMRLRTSHAQRLLLMTDAKILDVALDSGFGSASRFYESFCRFCGQTPRQYRLSMRRE
jgi:AraC family transcriptional regulator, melibiose operon regulatory protein